MPASFVSSLPAALRRAWPIITGGVKQGLSANSIQGVLKAAGMGVRRQTLLDGVRALRNGFAQQETLRILGDVIRPPLRMIPEALTRIRRRFSYLMEIQEEVESRIETRFFTLSSDDVLNRNEAISEATDLLENDAFKYGREVRVVGATLTGIVKAGSLGTL